MPSLLLLFIIRNQCVGAQCPENMTCVEGTTQFMCVCITGFTPTSNGVGCDRKYVTVVTVLPNINIAGTYSHKVACTDYFEERKPEICFFAKMFFAFIDLEIDECASDEDGCKEGEQYCTDVAPKFEGDTRFICGCDDGFEVFTGPGHNGYGMVVKYGEDVEEDPGTARVVNKTCIRTYSSVLVRVCN